MKNFKYLFIIVTVLCISQNINSQSKKDVKEMLIEGKEYDAKNQSYIKFNFQEHSSASTRYNIRFFDKAGDLEFWGHGKTKLSLLGPTEITIEGKDVSLFINQTWSTYKQYQKEIRKNQIAYEHLDINLLSEGSVVFTCYMDNRKSKYAFWVNKEKFPIDEKVFLEMIGDMKMYFDLEE